MTARLRMFAGPNGSGKSTVKSIINPWLLDLYLNPDEIEKQVLTQGVYDVRPLTISLNNKDIIQFFKQHPLSHRTALYDQIENIHLIDNQIINFEKIEFNSYFSAILTDFLRYKLLESKQSFTFETVMSSPDKIKTLERARLAGYRNYLYYVATDSPSINLTRIQQRVRSGGHNVPNDKVVERYHRSLSLLFEAIKLTDRAYIFDNSGGKAIWIAEITNGMIIDLKVDESPQWFVQAVLNKL